MRAAGLAEPLVGEHRRPAPVAADADAVLPLGEAARDLGAVGHPRLVRQRQRVHHLVDLHPAGQDGALLHPLQHREQLGEPVRRRGGRPAARPGRARQAAVGEDLEEELRPVGDGQLAAVEDGAGGRVERAAAGQAAPPAHAVGVAPVALDRRRAAARARVAVVAVEEIGLADQAGARVAVAVHVAVAVPDDPLGRGQLAVAGAVPRRGRRRRAPPLLFSAHGGSPRCPEGRRRRGLPHRKSIAVHPGGLADGCSVACDYRATRAAADALPTFCKGGFMLVYRKSLSAECRKMERALESSGMVSERGYLMHQTPFCRHCSAGKPLLV